MLTLFCESNNITLNNTGNSYFADSADDYDYHYYDIMQDNNRVGTIEIIDQFTDDNDVCYVDRIDVDSNYRNQGIGTEVLTNTLKDMGYDYVVVAPDNSDAQRLYDRIGSEYNYIYGCECDFGYNDQGYGVYII